MTEKEHDELALQRFSAVMEEKLKRARYNGRHGWWNPKVCSLKLLVDLFYQHVEKGDLVDIAILAMMIHQREGRPTNWKITPTNTWDKDDA